MAPANAAVSMVLFMYLLLGVVPLMGVQKPNSIGYPQFNNSQHMCVISRHWFSLFSSIGGRTASMCQPSVPYRCAQSLAGNVVALMYAGGQLLESFAESRARREMTALLGRVAFNAMRYRDHGLEEVPIAAIGQGDRLLIRKGEIVPVDGYVADGVAILDLSALTGESLPKTQTLVCANSN
jgi:cation transport ATPase